MPEQDAKILKVQFRKPARFNRVAAGIYRYQDGSLYERPFIQGRRTWRKLHSLTLKDAREELAARRSDQKRSTLGLALDPYQKAKTVHAVLDAYEQAGMPNHRGQARGERSQTDERSRLAFLRKGLGELRVDELNFGTARRYGESRGGNRAADLDLHTLCNALAFARREGLIRTHPLAEERPRFQDRKNVVHCRERMPADADELHRLAEHLFRNPASISTGFQLLLEAFTGCRTSEVLALRMDPKGQGQPGFIEGDWLWLKRSKNGTNPFALIHPALRQLIEAHGRWHLATAQGNPHWFPHSAQPGLPTNRYALTAALGRACKRLELPHRTSHGLRAFYVTVRRSQGASDGQIAAEIGDVTGASIIASTYGAVPPNWRGREALDWLPRDRPPAWTILEP